MKPCAILGMTLFFGLSTASVACTKTSEAPAANASNEEPEPSDGDEQAKDAAVDDDTPSTPKQECERYLACVNEATPEIGGSAVALYGDDAPCWKGSAADAKSCGDACRLARTSVPRNGKENPHCGCDESSECKGFCTEAQACTSAKWSGILDACEKYAAEAKAALTAWKKAQGGALPCAALVQAKCDGLRALDFSAASYAEDSAGRVVDPDDLRAYYALPRKDAKAWDMVGYAESGAGAPISCESVMLFGLAAASSEWQSRDLFVYVKP